MILSRLGIGEIGAVGQDRRLRLAVEGIDHEHGVARSREPLPHLAHRGAQAEGVGPEDDARMLPARRVDEMTVRLPVGGRDDHVLADDVHTARRLGRRETRGPEDREPHARREHTELPARQLPRSAHEVVLIRKNPFITHGVSSSDGFANGSCPDQA